MRRVALVALALAVLAGACKKNQPHSANLKAENKVTLRQVRLYFESADLLLAAETRNIELPENPAGALSATVRELFKGSANTTIPRPFPADAVVLGAYLLPDGTAFVDIGGATLRQGWGTGSHAELMAIYSVVQTVSTNFPQVKRVRILVNGEPAETLAGHISLAKALTPSRALVDPRHQ